MARKQPVRAAPGWSLAVLVRCRQATGGPGLRRRSRAGARSPAARDRRPWAAGPARRRAWPAGRIAVVRGGAALDRDRIPPAGGGQLLGGTGGVGKNAVTRGHLGSRPWPAALGSVAAPGRAEQAGDLGDSLVAGLDVAHDGARGLVPGLGHDQLQRDLLVAEVGRGGVTELMEVQAALAVVAVYFLNRIRARS